MLAIFSKERYFNFNQLLTFTKGSCELPKKLFTSVRQESFNFLPIDATHFQYILCIEKRFLLLPYLAKFICPRILDEQIENKYLGHFSLSEASPFIRSIKQKVLLTLSRLGYFGQIFSLIDMPLVFIKKNQDSIVRFGCKG